MRIEGPFDYIVLSDTIGMLDDFEYALRRLHRSAAATRVIIAYYSHLWEPILKLGGMVWACKCRQPPTNYLNTTDFLQYSRSRRFRADQAGLAPAPAAAVRSASAR